VKRQHPNLDMPKGKRKFHWKRVNYALFVTIRKTPKLEASAVYGRAIGLRKDGQTFSALAALPWIIPRKFDWRPIAKARLDSFLLADCRCKSEGSEVTTCKMHHGIRGKWLAEDAKRTKELPAQPNLSLDSGPVSGFRVMNRNYPWCVMILEKNEWFCDICKAAHPAHEDNPSYRNQFILRHSHCGFPAAGYAESLRKCNLSTWADAAAEARKRIDEARRRADKVEGEVQGYRLLEVAFKEISAGRCNPYLPERMSFEEVVQHAVGEGVAIPESLRPQLLEGKSR